MKAEKMYLPKQLTDDLLNENKLALLLMLLLIASAFGAVWMSHETRTMTKQQGKLIRAIHQLEREYPRLQLGENVLGATLRTEAASKKFGLQPMDKSQEKLLQEK